MTCGRLRAPNCSFLTIGCQSRSPPDQQRNLLEIVEDRYDVRSILITSQFPVDRWYEISGSPTHADAILDRVVHNAYRIALDGESLRKESAA